MSKQKPTVLTAFRRIAIVAGILIAFVIGLAGTVYLSLRSPEVKVPEILGQNYLAGQASLENAGLNIRRRAKRFKGDAKPDTILDQSPRAGEVVKKGQTVAVVTADENSGKDIPSEPPAPTEAGSGEAKPQNANANTPSRNENQNRDNRNRNANNRNANNQNNRNANNRNSNNQNNRNRNANQNANNRNANANRNGNANNRNANNRNSNATPARPNANTNRTPTLNINRNAVTPSRPNANNANRRPTP